ncbi:MAG: hypothetical protein ACOH2N_06950 [Devosia sp.]
MNHNDEHLQHCESRTIEALAAWREEHPGQSFTVEQIVADITEDQRCVYVLINSVEGAQIYLRATFDEVRFDYEGFSRRDWSQALLATARAA